MTAAAHTSSATTAAPLPSPPRSSSVRWTSALALVVSALVVLHGFSRRHLVAPPIPHVARGTLDEVKYNGEGTVEEGSVPRLRLLARRTRARCRHRYHEDHRAVPDEEELASSSSLPAMTRQPHDEKGEGDSSGFSSSSSFAFPGGAEPSIIDNEEEEASVEQPILLGSSVSLPSSHTELEGIEAGATTLTTAFSNQQRRHHDRVLLQVFIEALCVDSQRFVLQELAPAYQVLTSQVVDLELVVFGNARLRPPTNGGDGATTITCQHGPAECDANSYEQCAIHVLTNENGFVRKLMDAAADDDADPATASLAYVACLFTDLDMGYRDQVFDPTVFAACAPTPQVSFHVRACHDDPRLSVELQRRAAQQTPDNHTHVPWILINRRHTYDPLEDNDDADDSTTPSYEKLIKAICRAYRESSGGLEGDNDGGRTACDVDRGWGSDSRVSINGRGAMRRGAIPSGGSIAW